MNRTRKRILKCLYELNKTNPGQAWPFSTLEQETGLDAKVIARETDYLQQMDYIERLFIQTAGGGLTGFSYRIIASGINVIESGRSLWGRLSVIQHGPYTWLFLTILTGITSPFLLKLFSNHQVTSIVSQQNDRNVSLVYVTPSQFHFYKPDNPQVPGQEKVNIKIQLTNQGGSGYCHTVHARFFADDGTGHRTDSDAWNAAMGTPELYTFDGIGPLQEREVSWQPDVPPGAVEMYKTGRAIFKLAVYVTWQDIAHYKYEYLSFWEARYNKELDTFVLEPKETYNSLHDREKMRAILKTLLKKQV